MALRNICLLILGTKEQMKNINNTWQACWLGEGVTFIGVDSNEILKRNEAKYLPEIKWCAQNARML